MRRQFLLFAALLSGCQPRHCEPPAPTDLAPMADMTSPNDMVSQEAGLCVACDPTQTTGGACTPSRCAKAGDKFCCVF